MNILHYKHDLIPENTRTTPLGCMACRNATGIIWHGDTLLCAACNAASEPVTLTDADITNALMQTGAEDKPVLTARDAAAALARSERNGR